MACDLAPNCNFLFGYFSCNLPEHTIDVDITIHTLKGIHTFREDHTTQISKCSPWGLEVRAFPSIGKKTRECMEKRQALANLFSNRSYPSRLNPSLFAKQPKATPAKKRTTVAKPRNMNLDIIPQPSSIIGFDKLFQLCPR